MEFIPDVPEEIDIQLKRNAFVVEKLIEQVADDDDTDVVASESDDLLLQTYPLKGGYFENKM